MVGGSGPSTYLPSASGQAFEDEMDLGCFSFWVEGPWGYFHAWGGFPGYVLEILGYEDHGVTGLLFGYRKSKNRARAFDESGCFLLHLFFCFFFPY